MHRNFIHRHALIRLAILISVYFSSEIFGNLQNLDLELRLVQVVARHGARAPERPYPSDPNNDELKYWPNGWGQLTELGKQQQYQLGQFLRRTYGSFLSSKYSTKEVYVASSYYERCIQSAQLTMAGLFANESAKEPENTGRVICPSVPVHSYPAAHDRMLQPFPRCARFKKISKEVQNSHPEVVRRNEKYKDFLKDLSQKFGDSKPAKSFYDLALNNNALVVEAADPQNLTIPDWGQELLNSKELMDEVNFIYQIFTLTEEQKRLGTGPILTELVKNMQKKISGGDSRKLFYYSTHDLLLAKILDTLGLFKPVHAPEYSSCLIFELYFRSSTQTFEVKLMYKHATNEDDLRNLKIPNCFKGNETVNSQCTFETFSEALQPYVVENLDSECESKSLAENFIGISTLEASLIGLVVVLILLLVGMTSLLYRHSRTKRGLIN